MTSRFVVLFCLAFLLLSPVIKYLQRYFDEPIIIVAQDNSESIGLVTNRGSDTPVEYIKQFDDFYKSLSSEYETRYFSFGEQLGDTLSFEFDEKETNISELFDEIEKKLINYNIGAMVIASDGIYNRGLNPVYAAKDFAFPVYTIALGDTAKKHDVIVKNVFSNQIAFLQDYFPIEATLTSFGFKNQAVNVKVFHKGRMVAQQLVNIANEDYSQQLHFDVLATDKGLQSYTLTAEPKEGEFSKANNSQQFVIDVVDDKKKVLILSHAVHPDVGAIKNALNSNKNIIVQSYTFDQFKGNVSDYQMVVFHQLPSFAYNVQKLTDQLARDKIPVLFIVGPQTNVIAFNQLLTGISITNKKQLNEQVIPEINPGFKLFELDEKFAELIADCPPLSSLFGSYNVSGQFEFLLTQKIKGIKTNKPLLAFENTLLTGKAKNAYLFGEGIWRWRIKDYLLHENHEQFDAFINKIVQFLALDIKKERFMVYHKNIFNENEDIFLRAEFYNQTYELTNEPEVLLELTSADNKKYNYSFSKTGKAYNLNIGRLPQGSYQYVATTTFESKKFSKTGQVRVIPINIEYQDLTANHQLMSQLSMQSNGKMYYPDQMNELLEELKNSDSIKPVSHSITDLVDLIELKWIFFLLVFFLTVEWFVRKFYGAY